MAQILPFRWLGSARHAQVERELRRRVDAWSVGWLAPDAAVSLANVDAPARLHWRVAGGDAGAVAIGAPVDGIAAFGAALAGCAVAGGHGLADGVGRRALDDLAHALTGHAEPPRDGTRNAADLAARAGGCVMRMQIGAASLWLHIDAALCATWAPSAVATKALVKRRDAVGLLDARLRVTLPLGALALADVTGLKPGDVLRTTVRTGGLVRLESIDGTVARVGHLAASGDHRGIRIQ